MRTAQAGLEAELGNEGVAEVDAVGVRAADDGRGRGGGGVSTKAPIASAFSLVAWKG
jgi:hypothetical protein